MLRDGAEVDVRWSPQQLDVTGIRRIVNWAGLVIHESHHDVAAQQGVEFDGVYVAWQWYGSPASRDGLRPTRHITQVGDVATPDLDAFIEAIRGLPDRQSVRVKTVLLNGREDVLSVRLDQTYWPASEISHAEDGWRRTDID